MSTARSDKSHRRNKPLRRAQEHRRERRAVAQALAAVPDGRDGDAAVDRAWAVRGATPPWPQSEPLATHLERRVEERTTRELVDALALRGSAQRLEAVREIVSRLARVKRHRSHLAVVLAGWLTGRWPWSAVRTHLYDSRSPPAQLRSLLAANADLERDIRAFIETAGVLVGEPEPDLPAASPGPSRTRKEERARWSWRPAIPSWSDLETEEQLFTKAFGRKPVASRFPDAMLQLQAAHPLDRWKGLLVERGATFFVLGIDSTQRVRLLPYALKDALERSTAHCVESVIGRSLTDRENLWCHHWWSVKQARAALARVLAKGPDEAADRIHADMDAWLPPKKRNPSLS